MNRFARVQGHLVRTPALFFDVIQPGGVAQRLFVLDLIAVPLPFGDLLQTKDQMPAVIGMRGRPSGHFTQEVACNDRIGIRAAHSQGGLRRDLAGAHVTDAAAQPLLAEPALVLLRLHAGEAGIDAVVVRLDKHLGGCYVPYSMRVRFGFHRVSTVSCQWGS